MNWLRSGRHWPQAHAEWGDAMKVGSISREGERSIEQPILKRALTATHLTECAAGCLIFWKEAWLKPVNPAAQDDVAQSGASHAEDPAGASAGGRKESVVRARAKRSDPGGEPSVYVCQATPTGLRHVEFGFGGTSVSISRTTLRKPCASDSSIDGRCTTSATLWRGIPFPGKMARFREGKPTLTPHEFPPSKVCSQNKRSKSAVWGPHRRVRISPSPAHTASYNREIGSILVVLRNSRW